MKTLRYGIALWLAFLAIPMLYAQSFKISLGYGGTQDRLNLEPFNQFFTSFNKAVGVNLKSGFQPIPANAIQTHGFRGGLFYTGKDDRGLHTRLYLQTRANKRFIRELTFASNLKNEIVIDVKNNDFVFDVGYAGKNIILTASMAAMLRALNVEYATIYQDGSRSLSNEYDLNGFYELYASNVMLGGSLAFRFGRVLIPIHVLFPTQIVPDLDDVKLLDYSVSRYRANEFPVDYPAWVTNKIPTTEAERLAKDANSIPETALQGMRIIVGVEFLIGKKKRK